MSKTFARGSKRATAVEIIKNAAGGVTVEAILGEISKAIDVDMAGAKSYYSYIIKNGLASGPALSKAPKAKAPKAVAKGRKKANESIEKLIGQALATKKEPAAKKSLDEVKAIKSKNLETMRQVSDRLAREKKEEWENREPVDISDLDDREALKAAIPRMFHKELNLLD